MTDNKVYFGTVIWFNRGFGFVKPDTDGPDVFVHYSDVAVDGYKSLQKDQKVSFEIGLNKSGKPKAINVKVIK